MYSYFSKYGEVESVEVLYYRGTRRNRGFGFVVFKSPNDAFEVVNNAPHIINEKLVEVKYAIPRREMESSKNDEISEYQNSPSMNHTILFHDNQLAVNDIRNQSISCIDDFWNCIIWSVYIIDYSIYPFGSNNHEYSLYSNEDHEYIMNSSTQEQSQEISYWN